MSDIDLECSEYAAPVAIIFANLKGNLGDFAILHSMLDLIHLVEPGRPVHIYPHPLHSVDHERFCGFMRLSRPFLLNAPTYVPALSVYDRIQRILAPRLFKRLDVFQKHWPAASKFREFSRYRTVFVAGGDQWSGRDLSRVMFGTLKAISVFNSKIVAFPFSVKDSLWRSLNCASARSAFGLLCSPLLVRDSRSYNILSDLELPLLLTADSVFSAANNSFSPPAPGPPKSGRVILILKGDVDQLRVCVAEILPHFHNLELLTTCSCEDDSSYSIVAKEFGINVLRPLTWQDAVIECARSEIVISNRLHGLIFSSLAGAAVLPVIDRAKARAFADDAKLDIRAPSPAKVTVTTLKSVLSKKAEIVSTLQAFRASSAAERQKLIDVLKVQKNR